MSADVTQTQGQRTPFVAAYGSASGKQTARLPAGCCRRAEAAACLLLCCFFVGCAGGALSTARERSHHQQPSRRLFEHAAEAAAQRLKRGTSYRYQVRHEFHDRGFSLCAHLLPVQLSRQQPAPPRRACSVCGPDCVFVSLPPLHPACLSQPRHCVVLGWSEDHMHELMRSFAEFAPAGSTVTFVGQSPPAKHWPRKLGNVKSFEFIQHPFPTSLEVSQVLSGEARGRQGAVPTAVVAARRMRAHSGAQCMGCCLSCCVEFGTPCGRLLVHGVGTQSRVFVSSAFAR